MEALESLRTTRTREDRLRKQMELVDKRSGEAIAIEERSILEHEAKEALLSLFLRMIVYCSVLMVGLPC